MRGFLKLLLVIAVGLCFAAHEAAAEPGGPKLGSKAMGGGIDKSGDLTLRDLIQTVAPAFKAREFKHGDTILKYNLFTPRNLESDKKYPLVMFMADATTPGGEITAPLTQGYGALVWATPEFQESHPCFVLVPQFSGVAVNDNFERTPETDALEPLVKELEATLPVDAAKTYVTGQSMGGMLSAYLNATYPDLFAAALYVDCHWNVKDLPKLVKKPFIFICAGDTGKSADFMRAIDEACRSAGISFTTAAWSAKLPVGTQDQVAQTMLDKGAPVNLFNFEAGTVLPEPGKGSEHMYAFDAAYKLTPLRDWLFKYSSR